MTWSHNTSSQLLVHAEYRVHHLTTPCSVTHKRTTRSNLYIWAGAPLTRRSGTSRPVPFRPHAAGHMMMLKRQGHSKSPAKRNMPSKICSCRRIRWPVTHTPCAFLCSTKHPGEARADLARTLQLRLAKYGLFEFFTLAQMRIARWPIENVKDPDCNMLLVQ